MEGGVAIAVRLPNARAGVTNDPRRLRSDTDKRSPEGRLFRDLYDSTAAEFPGADGLRIRRIALLRFELEKAREAGTLTLEDAVRVDHAIERRERTLRLALRQRQAEQAAEGLRSKLSSRYRGSP
jgi:hypothetical protein